LYTLRFNTTGSNNAAFGDRALTANTTGTQNSAFGSNALNSNTTASNSVAIGYQALYSNTTADSMTVIGHQAGYSHTTTGSNYGQVYVGKSSGYTNLTGIDNTFIGAYAGYTSTAGFSTAVGGGALYSASSGAGNVAVGYKAGNTVTTGGNNVFIGTEAGAVTNATTTGSGNVYIGYQAYGANVADQREIAIGYNVAGAGSNIVTLGSDLGKIYCSYTVNATWTQTSDGRMKKDIKDDSLGLSFINRLRPVTFTWKPNNELDPSNPYYAEENKRDTTTVVHGLVAQEVKEALDAEGVDTFAGWVEGVDGVQAISREMYISPLIKAIQELTAKVNALESQLNQGA